jgi:periplasmic divalent cation tolerance protein
MPSGERDNRISLLYTTTEDFASARALVRSLFEKKLIACANLSKIESHSFWQGEITQTTEVGILIKTSPDRLEQAQVLIRDLHPYEVPAVVVLSESTPCNGDFAQWVQAATRSQPSDA